VTDDLTDDLRPQRRGRRIAMSATERDEFLAAERTCRVATTGADGPHATPLWYVWHDGALWLYSLTRSRRWADLRADPRIGVVIDAGRDYAELRGVEITGRVETVGEVPRTGAPHEQLAEVEELFAARYYPSGGAMVHDGKHGWLRVTPTKISSWDFRKLAEL
jgi:nitroimidazol reductase NimA-like FMN-containing flavoprotein (pyridoxamine 5'-phosphate oxidase superfamily)